jgi:hypothetical protein
MSNEGYEFETIVDNDITLPNGITIASRELDVSISSVEGLTLEGDVEMPFGLGETHVTGQLSKDGLSLSGSLKAGASIPVGNGLLLPTAEMAFSTSTNPNEGIYFEGKLELPHGIGFVDVEGTLTKDGFSFTGITNRAIDFAGVNLLSKSGKLTISSTNGIYFESAFGFGAGFGDQSLKGFITAQEIKLTGSFTRGLPIAGHTFTFTNGNIVASTLTGVVIAGNINLYVFTANVSGKMTSVNSFNLKGSVGYNGTYFKSTINVTVQPTAVSLAGNGTVYGLLGNQLYSGAISFKPNWGNNTIQACYNGNICIGL